jgi:2-polyprenyl-3-methyl-5-hydroxy-6-metoxy-1,4-benzoquinol methylase
MALPRKILRWTLQPVSWFYYRFLFGGDWPRLDRWMRSRERESASGDTPLTAAEWDDQYARGHWDLLHDPAELARYGSLLAFCQRLTPARTWLDVGCGDGLLRDLLRTPGYQRYVGVDLSEAAIERARRNADGRDVLVAADAETFDPGEAFDVVVLNESLYYFTDPLRQATRYLAMTAPGGVLAVSMFESRRTRAILRVLAQRLPLLEEVRVAGRRGTWAIAIFRPEPQPPLPLSS